MEVINLYMFHCTDYDWVKSFRTGTESMYENSKGSRAIYLQSLAHFYQFLLAAARLEESS